MLRCVPTSDRIGNEWRGALWKIWGHDRLRELSLHLQALVQWEGNRPVLWHWASEHVKKCRLFVPSLGHYSCHCRSTINMHSESHHDQVLWAYIGRSTLWLRSLVGRDVHCDITWWLAAISYVQNYKTSFWRLGGYRNYSFLHFTVELQRRFAARSLPRCNWRLSLARDSYVV